MTLEFISLTEHQRVKDELAEALAEVARLKAAQEWIDAKDRLPELPGRYLVLWYVPLTRGNISHSTGYFCRRWKQTWWESESKHEITVAYWMPLPEPPTTASVPAESESAAVPASGLLGEDVSEEGEAL